MNRLIEQCTENFNDGMLTSREYIGTVARELGRVYVECTEDNESEELVKLAQGLANRLGEKR